MKDKTTYRIINLTSGDNIIGQVAGKEEKTTTVYRPYQMKVITMMEDAGPHNMFRQEALIMRNWLELSKEEKVTIQNNQIVAITKPTDKVSELYDGEKEKEDNPFYVEELLEKLNRQGELEDDVEDEEDFMDDISNHMTLQIDPEDISEIIGKIINDAKNSLGIEGDEEEHNSLDEDDYHDTDRDMYGW